MKIIRNKRYRIEDENGKIITFHHYKRDAKKALKILTEKIVPIPEKIDTNQLKFPTEWKHPRTGKKVLVKQPKCFIDKKDYDNVGLIIAMGIYFNAKNPKYNPSGDMSGADWELKANKLQYTVKQLETYFKNNQVNPNMKWISRSQIAQVTNARPQEIDTNKSKMDHYYQYWFSYSDACKEVDRLKGNK